MATVWKMHVAPHFRPVSHCTIWLSLTHLLDCILQGRTITYISYKYTNPLVEAARNDIERGYCCLTTFEELLHYVPAKETASASDKVRFAHWVDVVK